MNPSDILIKELDELEKDLLRAKRNNGAIISDEAIKKLENKILDFGRSISILVAHKL